MVPPTDILFRDAKYHERHCETSLFRAAKMTILYEFPAERNVLPSCPVGSRTTSEVVG